MVECATLCATYDIVHVHMRHTYQYVRLAQIIARKKFKIVFHDHFSLTKVPMSLRFFFKPSYYIGVCQQTIEWAAQKVKVNPSYIFMLRNTIIPKSFVQKEKRDSWLMVSNIRPIKNIEFAIDLAIKNNANLTIIGNFSDDIYKNKILEMLAVKKNVSILENVFDVQSVISEYSLAIHTSFSETGPLVLLEYLSQGIPFLSFKVGEVSNILSDHLSQYFIDNFDLNSWSKRIQEINLNKIPSEKLKDIFYEYFSPDQYIIQCIQIYQKILNS